MLPWVVRDIDYHLCVKKFHLNSISACFSLASARACLLFERAVTEAVSAVVLSLPGLLRNTGLVWILANGDNFVTWLFGCSVQAH